MTDQHADCVVQCQLCHGYTFSAVDEICRACGAVSLAPLGTGWRCTDICDHAAGQFMCEQIDEVRTDG